MNKLHEINREQKSLGADFMQGLINNGQAWHMEGSIGRQCMDALRSGMCMLPKKAFNDAYGNRIPSRDELKQGEMGTYVNTLNYYNINHLVTIYYNDVFVSEIPNEIYENCPYVNVPINEAIEFADDKIDNGEWDAYCIPELIKTHQVIFHQ